MVGERGAAIQAEQHVALRYRAIEVVAVLAPADHMPVTAFVKQDGAPLPRTDAGRDVRFDSNGLSYIVIDAPREYELVMNKHFGQHDLELLPERPGLGVYTFDFEACEVGADR
jgi:hypothetical protein